MRSGGLRAALVGLALVCSTGGCAAEDSSNGAASTTESTRTPALTVDTSTVGTIDVELADGFDAATCDPIAARPSGTTADPGLCLLPFPNDHFTVADDTTDTGRRVAFTPEGLPANVDGVHPDPTDWNRSDGFSPGSPILAWFGDVDLDASGAAPITDLAASLTDESAIVLVDVDTGARVPHWVELSAPDDALPADERAAARMLVVHPAQNLAEGHRHVVAIRGLRTATDGVPVEATPAFRAYRDRLDSGVADIEARRADMEEVFAALDDAGVARDDLQLAWGFTVASQRSLSERILHARDDLLAALDGRAPEYTIDEVETDVDEFVARRITGTFTMPNYLTGDGAPGSRFDLGADGLPRRNGEITIPFRCIVPRVAVDGADDRPARASLYGHGLLGAEDEVSAGNVRRMANEHDIVFCAGRWIGMATEDIGNDARILTDFSTFPTLADRSQQGILGFIALGRLMTHPGGLAEDPAFQVDGAPVFATDHLYYDGNSQGGVIGGALVAVSPDIERAVLGVPAMNYSLLLPRSSDFEAFDVIYRGAYPDPLERQLLLGIVQMLWDRAETNGYAQHLTTDPYPGTPTHAVLLHVAYGDFQVAPVAAEVEARTIGAHLRQPAVADGRQPDVTPYWGIEPATDGQDGSVLVIWDSGAPTPPLGPTRPIEGRDPHEDPRHDAEARRQKSEWLQPDGHFVDVCGADPCAAEPAD